MNTIQFNLNDFPKFIEIAANGPYDYILRREGYTSARFLKSYETPTGVPCHELSEKEYLLFVLKWS